LTDTLDLAVIGNSAGRVWSGHAVLAVRLVFAAALVPFASAVPAAAMTLEVEASTTPPGFHRGDLLRYLVRHMAETKLADWRFEPAANNGSAADRVEWSFRLNPYAGGDVRNFTRPHMAERIFGVHRPITIEARLFLNGEYQTLVEKQAIIEGGPDDPDLAAAVASVTQDLLGPHGAFRAIDNGRRQAHGR